jgi:small acid-soluble spore protein H (minor)
MDAQRAQEISSTPNMKSVQYNGQEVYIEHVDRSNGLATIHPLNDPNNKQSVSISELSEV